MRRRRMPREPLEAARPPKPIPLLPPTLTQKHPNCGRAKGYTSPCWTVKRDLDVARQGWYKTWMQTFKVGDKAVYPGQGVGEVMGIEHKDIAGQRQSFYVLKIMENGMKILIPINKVGSVGLRSLIDEKAVIKVYGILKQKDISVDSATWNRRYRE